VDIIDGGSDFSVWCMRQAIRAEVIMSLGMHAQGRTRGTAATLRCRGFRARQFRKPICKLRRYKQLLGLSCVRLALCLRAFQLKVCRTLRLYA